MGLDRKLCYGRERAQNKGANADIYADILLTMLLLYRTVISAYCNYDFATIKKGFLAVYAALGTNKKPASAGSIFTFIVIGH